MTRQSFNPSRLEKLKEKRKACNISQNKTLEPYKHGAMVIKHNGGCAINKGGSAIIGYGFNNYMKNGSMHAEESAFRNAINYLRKNKSRNLKTYKARMKVDLIVLRTTGSNSRPCYNCITDQIVNNKYFNIRKIIYSDNDEVGGYVQTNKSKLFETRETHYSGFNATRLNIETNTNTKNIESNCCNTECNHHHEGYDEDNEDNEEDKAKEALLYFIVKYKV